jgi:hypothetical protein
LVRNVAVKSFPICVKSKTRILPAPPVNVFVVSAVAVKPAFTRPRATGVVGVFVSVLIASPYAMIAVFVLLIIAM